MNQIKFFTFLFCLVALTACQNDPTASQPDRTPFYLGGVQINEPDQKDWISTLEHTGMNTVSVTVYARQGVWNTDNFWWDQQQKAVVSEIKAAKEAGLHVVFIPRVTLDHYFQENKFLWHGMTMPQTDSMLVNWFNWYTAFLKHWAEVCEQNGVEVMAIGSEMRALTGCLPTTSIPDLECYYLNSDKQDRYLQNHLAFQQKIEIEKLWVRGADNYKDLAAYLKDEISANTNWAKNVSYQNQSQPLEHINQRRALLRQEWSKLIQVLRRSFSGQLTYASNFDNYHNIAFWDQLDFIGINAYFKLRKLNEPRNLSTIRTAWDSIFSQIHQFQKQQQIDKPIIFTELGYVDRENCTVMPWEGSGFSVVEEAGERHLVIWPEQQKDPQERTTAIRALYQAAQTTPVQLQGIMYWKLTSKAYHLPYEPFALHLRSEQPDSMQLALAKFLHPAFAERVDQFRKKQQNPQQ